MNLKITVTADCICDLGEDILSRLEVFPVYFHVITDSGDFKDMQEISSENVTEYLAEGCDKVFTRAPSADEFRDFFRMHRHDGGVIIHICAGSRISLSYRNACEAAEGMNDVYVYDSGQISSGMGLVVMKASKLSGSGMSPEEVISELDRYKEKVSATFLAYNADYLYINGKVKRFMKNLCNLFHIHPVLAVKKGKLESGGFLLGSHEFCCRQYIRSRMGGRKYDREALFVTYTGFSKKQIDTMIAEIKKYGTFRNIYITKASATVSVNCGPGTIGLMYAGR